MCYISYVAEGDFRILLRETRRMGQKKDRLIPLSEAKRVIYLEERGRNRKKLSAGAMIFGILGAICIIYCICISIAGFGSRFYLVWGVLGSVEGRRPQSGPAPQTGPGGGVPAGESRDPGYCVRRPGEQRAGQRGGRNGAVSYRRRNCSGADYEGGPVYEHL